MLRTNILRAVVRQEQFIVYDGAGPSQKGGAEMGGGRGEKIVEVFEVVAERSKISQVAALAPVVSATRLQSASEKPNPTGRPLLP